MLPYMYYVSDKYPEFIKILFHLGQQMENFYSRKLDYRKVYESRSMGDKNDRTYAKNAKKLTSSLYTS